MGTSEFGSKGRSDFFSPRVLGREIQIILLNTRLFQASLMAYPSFSLNSNMTMMPLHGNMTSMPLGSGVSYPNFFGMNSLQLPSLASQFTSFSTTSSQTAPLLSPTSVPTSPSSPKAAPAAAAPQLPRTKAAKATILAPVPAFVPAPAPAPASPAIVALRARVPSDEESTLEYDNRLDILDSDDEDAMDVEKNDRPHANVDNWDCEKCKQYVVDNGVLRITGLCPGHHIAKAHAEVGHNCKTQSCKEHSLKNCPTHRWYCFALSYLSKFLAFPVLG